MLPVAFDARSWSLMVQALWRYPHRKSRLEPKDRARSGHTGEERIPRAMMLRAVGPVPANRRSSTRKWRIRSTSKCFPAMRRAALTLAADLEAE